MRRQDFERLRKPYSGETRRLRDALALKLDNVDALEGEIGADFDDKVHGVGWWAPHPGTKRRILISDYLREAVRGTATNLEEAKLHQLELLGCWEAHSGWLQKGFDPKGDPFFKHPQATTPIEELGDAMGALHLVGFFRAIGSAIDCLAAAIVGVAGLDEIIWRVDFTKASKALARAAKAPPSDGQKIRATLSASFDSFLLASGPAGWQSWATNYRNMVVHRARRLVFRQLTRAAYYDDDGKVVAMGLHVGNHLPSEPGASDLQTFAQAGPSTWVLNEDAEKTVDGVIGSAAKLVEEMTGALLVAWRARRANPTAILQPGSQWPEVEYPPISFTGYDGTATPVKIDVMVGHTDLLRRLVVGSMAPDDARARWNKYD